MPARHDILCCSRLPSVSEEHARPPRKGSERHSICCMAAENLPDTATAGMAFRDNLRAFVPALRSVARGLCGRRDLADALARETMMRGWATRHSFAPGTNFRVWMVRIMRDIFYSTMCGERRFADWHLISMKRMGLAVHPQDDSGPLDSLNAALQLLPAAQREILILIDANGMSFEEVADITGSTIADIKGRLVLGRRTLAQRIDETCHAALSENARH